MLVERTGLVLVRAPVDSLWTNYARLAFSLWATSLPSSSVLVSFGFSGGKDRGDLFEFNENGSADQDAKSAVSTAFENLSWYVYMSKGLVRFREAQGMERLGMTVLTV